MVQIGISIRAVVMQQINRSVVQMLTLVFHTNDNKLLSMLTLTVRLAMLSLYRHPGYCFLVCASCRN